MASKEPRPSITHAATQIEPRVTRLTSWIFAMPSTTGVGPAKTLTQIHTRLSVS